MTYKDNTAPKIPVVNDSVSDRIDEDVFSGSTPEDKNRIIQELVGYVRKQNEVIRDLHEKIDPKEALISKRKVESLEESHLINHLLDRSESQKSKIKQGINKLSRKISPAGSRKNTRSVASQQNSNTDRKSLEEKIRAELLPEMKEDLRQELLAELGRHQEAPKNAGAKAALDKKKISPKVRSQANISAKTSSTGPIKTKANTQSVKTEDSSGTISSKQKKQTNDVSTKRSLTGKPANTPVKLQSSEMTEAEIFVQSQSDINGPEDNSFPWNNGALRNVVEEDEEDDEDDEIDNENLFSLTNVLNTKKEIKVVDQSAPNLIEVAKFHQGEVQDLQHVAVGTSYSVHVGDRNVKIASNEKNNRCQVLYQQRIFDAVIGEKGCTRSDQNVRSLQTNRSKKLIRYTLPPDKVVFLKAGNDEYRLRVVPTGVTCRVPETREVERKGFKHFLKYSAGFHLLIILAVGILFWSTEKSEEVKDEPRFAQVDLQQKNQVKPTPAPKPTPKPKPKPTPRPAPKPTPAPKKVDQPKIEKVKPKPAPKKQKVKVTKKPTTVKPKPKNAGGGAKQGGNLKKRDVKQSGLLAALGTKSGKKPGNKQALATVSSLDAVSSLDSDSATLKVGGLAAKVKGSRIEIASGELLDTKGSASVLRSGGAEGEGSVAALESGVTGNRAVKGKVVANMTRKVKIKGGLSRDEVKRVIDAHMDEVVYCYEKTLLTTPGLAGKAVFEWKVLLSGRVGEVNIQSSTLRSGEIHSCIKRAIKTWQFPKPSGAAVFVSYPFIFDSVEF